MRERKYAFNVLVGKSEGKKPLARPRHRWEVYETKEIEK
jgi:hypothetical protein